MWRPLTNEFADLAAGLVLPLGCIPEHVNCWCRDINNRLLRIQKLKENCACSFLQAAEKAPVPV